MKNAKITIKNYRGFPDDEPATFEIGTGFTAFVGRNNAGKSSAKLLFYELRPLLQVLAKMNPAVQPGMSSLLQGTNFNFGGYAGVADPLELFHNKNSRPITVEIEVVGAAPVNTQLPYDCIGKVLLSANRARPLSWNVLAYGSKGDVIRSPNGWQEAGPGILRRPDGKLVVETKDIGEVLQALSNAHFYGAFRNAINTGGADYFDLKTGTAFIELWNNWKTSGIKAQTRAIGQVTEDIRRLFEFNQLEINASTALHTLMVTIDQHAFRLPELAPVLRSSSWYLATQQPHGPPSYLSMSLKPTYILRYK